MTRSVRPIASEMAVSSILWPRFMMVAFSMMYFGNGGGGAASGIAVFDEDADGKLGIFVGSEGDELSVGRLDGVRCLSGAGLSIDHSDVGPAFVPRLVDEVSRIEKVTRRPVFATRRIRWEIDSP